MRDCWRDGAEEDLLRQAISRDLGLVIGNGSLRMDVLTSESEEFRRRPRQLRQMPMNERSGKLCPQIADECTVWF